MTLDMKKIGFKILLPLIVALSAMLLSTGCEKHAYSISTNIFRYSTGSGFSDLSNKLSLKTGQTAYIIATSKSGERFDGGVYSVSAQAAAVSTEEGSEPQPTEQNAVKVSPDGTFNGFPCIVVEALAPGSASVSLNFEIMGFRLYKTVTVTVK